MGVHRLPSGVPSGMDSLTFIASAFHFSTPNSLLTLWLAAFSGILAFAFIWRLFVSLIKAAIEMREKPRH